VFGAGRFPWDAQKNSSHNRAKGGGLAGKNLADPGDELEGGGGEQGRWARAGAALWFEASGNRWRGGGARPRCLGGPGPAALFEGLGVRRCSLASLPIAAGALGDLQNPGDVSLRHRGRCRPRARRIFSAIRCDESADILVCRASGCLPICAAVAAGRGIPACWLGHSIAGRWARDWIIVDGGSCLGRGLPARILHPGAEACRPVPERRQVGDGCWLGFAGRAPGSRRSIAAADWEPGARSPCWLVFDVRRLGRRVDAGSWGQRGSRKKQRPVAQGLARRLGARYGSGPQVLWPSAHLGAGGQARTPHVGAEAAPPPGRRPGRRWPPARWLNSSSRPGANTAWRGRSKYRRPGGVDGRRPRSTSSCRGRRPGVPGARRGR